MKKIHKKGFTMIEMLVVVAIIAVLAIVAIPMITGYMQDSKDKYNDNLKKQLIVSGKEYYTNNKTKLPVKNYLGVYNNNKDYDYVSVSQLQSENFLSGEFIDSDGRKCSESYVFVRQDYGTDDYEWHACLKCEGDDGKIVNYSEDDAACNISDWGDKVSPVCSPNASFSGGKTFDSTNYNPATIKLNDIYDKYSETNPNGRIADVKIVNETTNKKLYALVDGYDNNKIMNLNLRSIIDKQMAKDSIGSIDGKYYVLLQDASGHESANSCANFTIDRTAPSCDLIYEPTSSSDKLLKLKSVDHLFLTDPTWKYISSTKLNKDNISSDFYNKVDNPLTKNVKYDGVYYGYVTDKAGNSKECQKDVKVKMYDDEEPYCNFVDDKNDAYLGIGKTRSLKAECYVSGGEKSQIDISKIKTRNGLGTIVVKQNSSDNNNKENKVLFTITYSTIEGKSGIDNIDLLDGVVKSEKGLSNKAVTSSDIKVDAIAPVITYTPLTTKQTDGWYKAPFELKMSCSDSGGSGVSSFAVNGTTVSNPKTITRTTAANPGTWTTSCKDGAGNVKDGSNKYYVKVYNANSTCGVDQYKSCRTSACGVSSYKSCRTSACGCQTYKACSSCGCSAYGSWVKQSSTTKCSSCVGSGTGLMPATGCKASTGTTKKVTCGTVSQVKCTTGVAGGQYTFKRCQPQITYTRSCSTYKRCSSCGCQTYNSCRNKACGVESYNSCRNKACGVESYNKCWHY